MRDVPQPAIIISQARSGSTFLTHCLSNHPDIFCCRGEPMHTRSVWSQTLHQPDSESIDRWREFIGIDLLHCLLHQQFYAVSMCELTRRQAFRHFWEYLIRTQPKIILLSRENVIRQVIEIKLAKMHKQGKIQQPAITMVSSPEVRVRLAPQFVLRRAQGYREATVRTHERCQVFENLLEVTYANIVGGERRDATSIAAPTSMRICTFLGVPPFTMSCRLRAINPRPLRDILLNWDEVQKAVAQSELAYCLEDEQL